MSSKYVDEEDQDDKPSRAVDEGKSPDKKDGGNGGGGKTADDEAGSTSDAVVDPFKPKPPNLVQRFVEFAFSMLHTKMDSFFERHAAKFDQEWDDYLQSGETLEQYEIFKEYEELLDENLTEFVHKEGFKSVGACFNEISNLIEEDKAKKEEEMRKIQERLRKAQEAMRQQQLEKEGKTGEGSKTSDENQENNPPPLQFFYQPITLEQLINMVLNMAEYQTFSFMMRMKVQQMKMMKRLKEQMAQLQEAAEERARQAEKDKQLELENGGGKTSTPEEEDDAQKEYDIHNARKK